MNTPFSKYINSLLKAYEDNWENIDSIDNVIHCFKDFKSSGYFPEDNIRYFVFENKMFVFQNPTIPDIVNEFKDHDFYKQYKSGNTKMLGALIGQIIKKYPSCDIVKVQSLVINS